MHQKYNYTNKSWWYKCPSDLYVFDSNNSDGCWQYLIGVGIMSHLGHMSFNSSLLGENLWNHLNLSYAVRSSHQYGTALAKRKHIIHSRVGMWDEWDYIYGKHFSEREWIWTISSCLVPLGLLSMHCRVLFLFIISWLKISTGSGKVLLGPRRAQRGQWSSFLLFTLL